MPTTKMVRRQPSKNDAASNSWWQFGTSAWLLIAGLVVFNGGIFVQPNMLDTSFVILGRAIDFRLYPWYYFVFLGTIIAFSVRWFFIVCDEDREVSNEVRTFIAFSSVTTSLIVLYVILRQTPVINAMYYSLYTWLGFGTFSWLALLSFVTVMACICATIGTAWIWITSLRMD